MTSLTGATVAKTTYQCDCIRFVSTHLQPRQQSINSIEFFLCLNTIVTFVSIGDVRLASRHLVTTGYVRRAGARILIVY